MELTELKGVGPAEAERLRAAGLRTTRDLQRASDEALREALGAELAQRVRRQVGRVNLDEKGRTDYLRTLNVAREEELNLVKVEPLKVEEAHARGGTRRVRFKVWRTPADGGAAREAREAREARGGEFREYDVDVEPGTTVLQALHAIKETQDPTLTFRRSCGQAICGICAVRINRIPRLVCNTLVEHALAGRGELVLQPLGNLPTIRDLVSDHGPFWAAVERLRPWLIRSPEERLDPDHESVMHPDDLPDVIQMANCINCAVCFSDCDARRGDEGFLGPMAAAKVYRFVADPRDGAREERLKAVEEAGLWRCMFAYQCAWCPKGVEPQEAIVALRKHLIDTRGYEHPGARHTLAFVKSVRDYGRLNEGLLPLVTNGPLKSLKEVPKALRWARKGKVPRVHWIEGRKEADRFLIQMEAERVAKRKEEEAHRLERLRARPAEPQGPAARAVEAAPREGDT